MPLAGQAERKWSWDDYRIAEQITGKSGLPTVCLAIPGRIIEFLSPPSLAVVEVGKVRRRVNVDLLRDEGLAPDDWVLIHVGFAMSKISEKDAQEQMRLLAMLGEDGQAMEELEGYQFG